MAEDVETFEHSGSEAAGATPKGANLFRKGHYVVIKDRPCKILDLSTSKTGKHGHAKMHIVAVDIFSGKKCEALTPTSDNMLEPTVTKTDFSIMDISDDGFMSLMDEAGTTRQDLKLPEGELGDQIKARMAAGGDVNCVVYKALGIEQVMELKDH